MIISDLDINVLKIGFSHPYPEKLVKKFLENNKEVLDEKAGFTVKLFAPYEAVEVEYVLHNEVKQEARYVIFYSYLPVRLLNKLNCWKHIPIDWRSLLISVFGSKILILL